jgi:drug/metabolite transporter (DMT)-like permease
MDPRTEARLKRWIDSVGTVTLPLLAGFSITAVVVVSDDPAKFLWPGATILVLAFAALALIVAVQFAYHAHVYLPEQGPDQEKGLWWARRTRWFYDAGLLALLAGLALVVAPHHVAGIQDYFRLAAVVLACAALLCEVAWLLLDPWLGPRWAAAQA